MHLSAVIVQYVYVLIILTLLHMKVKKNTFKCKLSPDQTELSAAVTQPVIYCLNMHLKGYVVSLHIC